MGNNKIYFSDVVDKQKEAEFNVLGTQYVFDLSRTIQIKTLRPMLAAINHVFDWAYDKERTTFYNKLSSFIIYMQYSLSGPNFEERIALYIKDTKDSKLRDETEANKMILQEIVDSIDNGIIDGIIEYVDDNKVINTEPSKEHTLSLDDEDVFILICIITINKILNIGISMLKKARLEYYSYDITLYTLIDRFKERLQEFYLQRGDIKKYEKVAVTSFKDTIFNFMYTNIESDVSVNTHMSIFFNAGLNLDMRVDTMLVNALTTIYKLTPIEYENPSSKSFEFGDDYKHFKFVFLNVIKYIKTCIKNITMNVSSETVKNRISTYNGGKETEDSIYRHELFLEKKNTVDIMIRREHVAALNKYVNEYIANNSIVIESYPIRTALSDYFVLLFMNEISQDISTLKLLDNLSYARLTIVLSHKLAHKWRTIAIALRMDETVPTSIAIHPYMPKIEKLRHYQIDSERTIKSIKSIIELEYKNKSKNQIVSVDKEFIEFLLEYEKTPFVFMDKYIYNYG